MDQPLALLAEDVREGLCRRRTARIWALDKADLPLDPNVEPELNPNAYHAPRWG